MKSLFKKMLDRITAVSLFVKMMGLALLLTTLFGVTSIIEIGVLMHKTLREQMRETEIAVARQLDDSLTEPVVTEDILKIHKLLKDTLKAYPDVRYLVVLDDDSQVIAHTFEHPISADLVAANEPKPDGMSNIEVLDTEEGAIDDIAWPILGGKIGILRIGMAEKRIRQAFMNVVGQLAFSVVLIGLAGIGISYILAFILNKPLAHLIKGVDEIRRGNLNIKVRPWFKDEIGELSEAFNDMTCSLKNEHEMRLGLMQKLIATQEEERQRISRELHDMTSQSLSSLKICLKALESHFRSPEAVEKLEGFRSLLNSSLEEIHSLSVELRPPLLSDFGLFKAVEELADKFKKNLGIKVDYEVADSLRNQRLLPALETGLYRIMQEAFLNIEKHAEAKSVRISFGKSGSSILILIRDDGRGFDDSLPATAAQRKSIGLFGMRERAEILGGIFRIVSHEGKGTRIDIEVPIQL